MYNYIGVPSKANEHVSFKEIAHETVSNIRKNLNSIKNETMWKDAI